MQRVGSETVGLTLLCIFLCRESEARRVGRRGFPPEHFPTGGDTFMGAAADVSGCRGELEETTVGSLVDSFLFFKKKKEKPAAYPGSPWAGARALWPQLSRASRAFLAPFSSLF